MRAWVLLASLAGGNAWGAAPVYSVESIVNASDYTPGPFAPGSVLSIFGAGLSFGTLGLTPENTTARTLPLELSNVRVYMNNQPAALLYVCPTQINFLVPNNLKPGNIPLRVVRQGVSGAEVMLALVDAAPHLFKTGEGWVLAQHGANYSVVTADSPAAASEVIVIYATGLGRTQPTPGTAEIPNYPSRIAGQLKLSLGDTELGPERIWYAGVTPGLAGVYQINVQLPESLGANPEIVAAMAGQGSAPGIRLATQLNSSEPR